MRKKKQHCTVLLLVQKFKCLICRHISGCGLYLFFLFWKNWQLCIKTTTTSCVLLNEPVTSLVKQNANQSVTTRTVGCERRALRSKQQNVSDQNSNTCIHSFFQLMHESVVRIEYCYTIFPKTYETI